MDEVALIDIPEGIDYGLECTKQEKLDYVCHSTDCDTLLMLLRERPEYSRFISHPIFWAPSFHQHLAYLPSKLEAVLIKSGLLNY